MAKDGNNTKGAPVIKKLPRGAKLPAGKVEKKKHSSGAAHASVKAARQGSASPAKKAKKPVASEAQAEGDDEPIQVQCQGLAFPAAMVAAAQASRERVAGQTARGFTRTAGVMANNKQEKFLVRPDPAQATGQNSACTMLLAHQTQDPHTRSLTTCILFDDMSKPNPRYEVYGAFVVVAAGRQLKGSKTTPHQAWTEHLTHGALTVVPYKFQWFGLFKDGDDHTKEPWAYVNLYTAREDYEQMEALILDKKGAHERMRFIDFVARCTKKELESELGAAHVLWRHPDPLHPASQQTYDTLQLKDCHPDNALFTFFVQRPIDSAPFTTATMVPLQLPNAPLPGDYTTLYQ